MTDLDDLRRHLVLITGNASPAWAMANVLDESALQSNFPEQEQDAQRSA